MAIPCWTLRHGWWVAVIAIFLLVAPCRSFPQGVPRRPTRSNHFRSRHSSSNNNESFNNPASALTKALARFDQRGTPRFRWKTIRIDKDQKGGAESTTYVDDLSSSVVPEDIVYLLDPPNPSIAPSCLLVFVGGAGLGTYPQVAYNELLLRLSDRLNAAVLATPYTVGLDHFVLAQETGERITRAMELLRQREDVSPYSSNKFPPVYCLTHSLGGKLMTIHMAATNAEYAGMGWISFNNFSFGQTIGMTKVFAEQLQSATLGQEKDMPSGNDMGGMSNLLDTVFTFAETALSAIGIDFSPTSEQMEKLIALKYRPEWQAKTRLFTFDADTLQSTEAFCKACRGPGPDVSELKGTHLTPVFFEVGLDEIPDENMKTMAREAMGGIQKASFGDETQLNDLVNEICSWILGKPPSRRPAWKRERPQIEGASDASSEIYSKGEF
jgi:hypothetical protein